MEKAKLEGRSQLETLQGELTLSRRRSSELEGRVAEIEEQVASLWSQVTEAERQLALLRGEQDVTCAEAFQLGAEEVRTRISREHPEWDLSYLEVEGRDVQTPGTELSAETEYEEVSDVDVDALLGADATVDSGVDGQKRESHPSDAGAPGAHRSVTFEAGEPSHVSPESAADSPEVRPLP